jgi:multidrug/hemolysin transport system ATP-binding protein
MRFGTDFLQLTVWFLPLSVMGIADRIGNEYSIYIRITKSKKGVMDMEAIIDVKHLKKNFKDIKAVDNISFQVEKGELFGFLGVNGAGKSTTINMLCTLFPPTEGSISVCGYQVGKEDQEIRKRIGVVYQNNCLDERLTVKENLLIRGSFYEKDQRKVKDNYKKVCDILELEDMKNRQFAKLSGGQKRRCEIARALMNTPEILFLDEPTTGLDPATRKSVWDCIALLRQELNMTVFLTTHYMEEAAKASHIAIMDSGHLKEYGTPFSLKDKFAKDKLHIVPGNRTIILDYLRDKQITFKDKHDFISLRLQTTMDAIPLLEELKEVIKGFEVIQGSMDDVFLNVTGKTLE